MVGWFKKYGPKITISQPWPSPSLLLEGFHKSPIWGLNNLNKKQCFEFEFFNFKLKNFSEWNSLCFTYQDNMDNYYWKKIHLKSNQTYTAFVLWNVKYKTSAHFGTVCFICYFMIIHVKSRLKSSRTFRIKQLIFLKFNYMWSYQTVNIWLFLCSKLLGEIK